MVQVALGPDASGEKVRPSVLHPILKWNQLGFINFNVWVVKEI